MVHTPSTTAPTKTIPSQLRDRAPSTQTPASPIPCKRALSRLLGVHSASYTATYLKVIDKLLQLERAIELESVPQRPLFVVVHRLERNGSRLSRGKQRQREVEANVLVCLDRQSLRNLDQLDAGESSHRGSGRHQRRDDLA